MPDLLVSFLDGLQPRKGTSHVEAGRPHRRGVGDERLVSVAADRAGLTALIGGPGPDGQPGGGAYSYASLASDRAGRGGRPDLARAAARDVVGVLAPDAVGFALATHAVRAAGGVPSPLDADLCAVETAGQLAESGARMVITAPPLADTALAAVDRSWVRQVFSFVDAPGATRFSDLLGLDMIRPSRGRPDDVALLPFSRGQNGRLRPAPVTHRELVELIDQADQGAGFTSRDVVIAMPPVGDGLVLRDADRQRAAPRCHRGRREQAGARDRGGCASGHRSCHPEGCRDRRARLRTDHSRRVGQDLPGPLTRCRSRFALGGSSVCRPPSGGRQTSGNADCQPLPDDRTAVHARLDFPCQRWTLTC